ncbi:MAG: tyrosine-type recombinase/integrase [Ignavibacteriaceae bacterium]
MFHSNDLRKYCLSELANHGVAINFVKEYAGHNSINTTLKYYIRVDEKKMKTEIDEKVNFGTIQI